MTDIKLSAETVRALIDVKHDFNCSERCDEAGMKALKEARIALELHELESNPLGLPWDWNGLGHISSRSGWVTHDGNTDGQVRFIAATPELAQRLEARANEIIETHTENFPMTSEAHGDLVFLESIGYRKAGS